MKNNEKYQFIGYHISPYSFEKPEVRHQTGCGTSFYGAGFYVFLKEEYLYNYMEKFKESGKPFYVYKIGIENGANIVDEYDEHGGELYLSFVDKYNGDEMKATKAMVGSGVDGVSFYNPEDGPSIVMYNPNKVTIVERDDKMKLTIEQLKQSVLETLVGENESERRTEPFYFDHAVLSPASVRVDTTDAYGRRLEKVYDRILVYTSPSLHPYYIWTQFQNGQKVVDRLTANYEGKWVTAKLGFEGGTMDRISSVGWRVVPEPRKEPEPTPEEKPVDVKPSDEPVQLELFENGKMKFSQLKSMLFEGISDMAHASFERDLAKVQRAVDRFNAIREQAVRRMGTEDSLYLETGSTFESPPSYISEMEVEVTDKQVRVNWVEQEHIGWKIITTSDSEFDWRDKNGGFDPDVIIDTVNFKIRGVKKAMKYWEKVNPDNEEQVAIELERDDD